MEKSQSQRTKESLAKNRRLLEDLLKRRFFYGQSFEIYNGVGGLYDYGPSGQAVLNNIVQLWREHFVLEEDMLEIGCTNITPENVLKVSGHVERFSDLMVKDTKNGNAYRADKLITEALQKKLQKESKKLKEEEVKEIEGVMIQIDSYNREQIDEVIKKYSIKSADNNELGQAEPFNLMFATQIGPTGTFQGYLRPETAQGIFLNFNRLLDFNQGKMPLAGAQIGLGFRNEISPRMGLLRVREFMMAEIEHFIDPKNTDHARFVEVKDVVLRLYSGKAQEQNQQDYVTMSIGEAVEQKLVDNQTLGYFMARSYLFLKELGIDDDNIRFRQHMSNEMAHYASDCWDAEVETSYGWIECIGHANRNAYDLVCHSKASGTKLAASRRLQEPKKVQEVKINIKKGDIGKQYKKEAQTIIKYLEDSENQQKLEMMKQMESDKQIVFNVNDKEYKLDEKQVNFEIEEKTVHEESFIPQVIEPSFGIGRLVYCVLEHAFRMRDEKRTYLSFKPRIAPVKCSILSVINHQDYKPYISRIKQLLKQRQISCKVDDGNATIGKRYARTDEIGIPFGITIDANSIDQNNDQYETVTLREIETMKQVRLSINELQQVMVDLSDGMVTWDQVLQKYTQ